VPVAPNVALGLLVINNSGGSYSVAPISLFYEVMDPNWVIGA
jgi:hypothetical protein